MVKLLFDVTGWASLSPFRCGIVLTERGTTFWMGAAIVGTISTCIGISSPVRVSISTVATPSLWCVLAVLPNDAKDMSAVAVGDIPNSLAISTERNDRCAPSSKRMLALVLVCPAMIGATAVLSRQLVTGFGVTHGEVGVRSSVTSAEEIGGLLSRKGVCSRQLVTGCGVTDDEVGVSVTPAEEVGGLL